jgi:hypothetical protein
MKLLTLPLTWESRPHSISQDNSKNLYRYISLAEKTNQMSKHKKKN